MQKRSHKIKHLKVTVLIFMLVCAYACNPTRKLNTGEYLLEKNIIVDKHTGLDAAEVETFIRQKPNRKILKTLQFHLWLYNTIDQKKIAPHKERRDKKFDRINDKRRLKAERKNRKIDRKNEKIRLENIERDKKGLAPKKLKEPKVPKFKDKAKLTWRQSVMDAGEAPVVLDSFQTKVSREQIQKYLFTKGFFNSRVKDSVIIVEYKKFLFFKYKKRRAYVYYKISPSTPYYVNNIEYKIDDEQLSYYVFQDTLRTFIKRGARYDADILQKERERIVSVQKNNGYFDFAQDYIYFLVDTNLNAHKLNITLGIKNYAFKDGNDSIVKRPHTRYYINKIYIIQDYMLSNKSGYKDSLEYNGVIFLYNEKLKFKKRDLANKVMFHEGEIFVNDLAEETYSKITDLRVFKNVNLLFEKTPGASDKLDCFIQLMPILKQNFTIETEGTNTSGNLGVAGSIVYQNRNVFRGAELLEVKLRGGLTAQQNFATDNEVQQNFLSAFNTFQFGPELNLYIPKQLFPFTVFKFNKNASPKTIFNSSLNFQKRPEFSRSLSNVSYGFQFKSGQYIRQSVVPFEFNVIKADLSDEFEANLNDTKDFFLKNSFSDHVTTVSRYSFIYNNQTQQNSNKRKYFTYLKLDAESSGNILRGIYNLTEQPKDTAGRYQILNVPFAQFLRFNYDYRLYKTIRKLGRLVFRATGGVGKPLHNLRVLPYEKSFFGGGPNSIRAWKARTVGPGSYNSDGDKNATFDKIGDAQLEFNLEYRFNIYKFLNGAWFIDAGNIWLRKPDPLKPGADFKLDRFYKEFATGSGFGLRADFSFFIIRLDAAIKIYDPKYVEGNRFTFDKKPLSTGVINFGIGYPF
ncbi:MAG TPA: BamA/TamA family outer membrane protein [Bacteroidia bacterium]